MTPIVDNSSFFSFFTSQEKSTNALPTRPSQTTCTEAREREALSQKINQDLASNEALLNHYSRLNQLRSQSSSINQLVDLFKSKRLDLSKALALTSLSYSALNTGYEGWNLSDTATLYSILFDCMQSGEAVFSKAVAESVRTSVAQLKDAPLPTADTLQSLALEAMQAVERLAPEESYVMPGGWFGIPSGHAMIYRFERTASETFNIYIYDAQQGAEAEKGGQEVEGRKRTHPYLLLKDVQWEELFFCKPGESAKSAIFKNLLSLQVSTSSPKNYSRYSVYSCFGHLQHRQAPTDTLPHLFISMQRSGNCPVKSMNCLLLDLLHSPEDFKKLSLDVRLLSLVACYLACKDQLPPDSAQREVSLFQLREATKNFLRVLNANFKRQGLKIGQDEYATACATAHHLLKELDEWEASLKSAVGESHHLKATYQREAILKQCEKRLAGASSLNNLFKVVKEENSCHAVAYDPLLGQQASWDNLEQILASLRHLMGQIEQQNSPQNLIFQVEAVLRQN